MIPSRQRRVVLETLSLPTAPFVEGAVAAYVEAFCHDRRGLTTQRDRVGNILVHLRKGRRRVPRPVCLTAHLDHPGFIAEAMTGQRRLKAVWRGGVLPEYFPEAKVRFWADGRWTRGVVRTFTQYRDGPVKRVRNAVLDVRRPVPPGAPGMWDLPDAVIRNGRIQARACDDLAGVAAMLCCIEEVLRTGPDAEAYFLFTRAEEVGFAGALGACRARTVPQRCCVVVVETSSELPSARIGDGPVLRVGDKATIYHDAATAHCRAVADELARRSRKFAYQRKLMDGGTCEATAFGQHGYEATGICLALGNYHNMNRRTGRLAAEYVSEADFANLVRWFVELVRGRQRYADHHRDLQKRLAGIEAEYRALLRSTRDLPTT